MLLMSYYEVNNKWKEAQLCTVPMEVLAAVAVSAAADPSVLAEDTVMH
jgi:hypothetical protein